MKKFIFWLLLFCNLSAYADKVITCSVEGEEKWSVQIKEGKAILNTLQSVKVAEYDYIHYKPGHYEYIYKYPVDVTYPDIIITISYGAYDKMLNKEGLLILDIGELDSGGSKTYKISCNENFEENQLD